MLIEGDQFRKALEFNLKTSIRCYCYSAFLTSWGGRWLLGNRSVRPSDRLLVRGLPADCLNGVCNLATIRDLLNNGFGIRISSALHAKVYIFDEQMFAGSANLTGKGLALVDRANDELGMSGEVNHSDLLLLDHLWQQATVIDGTVLDRMEAFLTSQRVEASSAFDIDWPESVLIERRDLYCSDFPQEYPSCDPRWESFASLAQTTAYRWLYEQVSSMREVSFGQLSSALHDTLFDDPIPYRRDVKLLLSNLLALVQELDKSRLEIHRPRHRQVVRMR